MWSACGRGHETASLSPAMDLLSCDPMNTRTSTKATKESLHTTAVSTQFLLMLL